MKPLPPPTPDLALADFAEVPPRGNVAIAVRCVHRLAPFFRIPESFEDREACISIYDAALVRAIHYASGGVENGDRLQELIDAAYQMAELTADLTDYAGYAVAHAAQAVGIAHRMDVNPGSMDVMNLVASTFGAARVLIQRCRALGSEAGVLAVRADLDAMKEVPVAPGVDPSESGPLGALWRDGKPAGF